MKFTIREKNSSAAVYSVKTVLETIDPKTLQKCNKKPEEPSQNAIFEIATAFELLGLSVF